MLICQNIEVTPNGLSRADEMTKGRFMLKVKYPGERQPGWLLADGRNVAVKLSKYSVPKEFKTAKEAYQAGIALIVKDNCDLFHVIDADHPLNMFDPVVRPLNLLSNLHACMKREERPMYD